MTLIEQTRTDFENNFKDLLLGQIPGNVLGLREMISYHFGWDNPHSVPGKRLRPLFLLLTYGAFGGNPQVVMAQAAAMETLHNYTLIHDDIEDCGETRHGQTALWKKYGLALGVNVGDYLASLSHVLMSFVSPTVDLKGRDGAMRIFQTAALEVVQGQQLDISYEQFNTISVEQYLEMIRLKTSRLFAASLTIGASLMGQPNEVIKTLDEAGEKFGLGFQILDDYLGIWGDQDKTGKSVSTDLLMRKKAYPALAGLGNSDLFRQLWYGTGDFELRAITQMRSLLEGLGIRQDTIRRSNGYFMDAEDLLGGVLPLENPYSLALIGLARKLASQGQ